MVLMVPMGAGWVDVLWGLIRHDPSSLVLERPLRFNLAIYTDENVYPNAN